LTLAETTILAFTTCNTLRVLAYVPQVLRIARDTEGAKAISYTTWGLFTISNLSTVAYALVAIKDVALAIVFAGNTTACVAIIGLTIWKRRRFETRQKPVQLQSSSKSKRFQASARPVTSRAA
jgi:uncharacterized protein with PQ loop repeat